jgi:cell division septal protein FtsQ
MKKRFTFIALPILLLAGSAYLLGYSTVFTVSNVEIIGIKSAINPGVSKGEKLARIQPRVIATKFENLAWVKNAEVSRNWFNGKVTIRIIARTPIAIYNGKAFDIEGKTFDLQGSGTSELVQIQASDTKSALEAVDLLTVLDSQIKQSLRTVTVQKTGSLDLLLAQDSGTLEIKWGLNSENELKTRVYEEIIALPENNRVTRIDLSAPHAPIVK